MVVRVDPVFHAAAGVLPFQREIKDRSCLLVGPEPGLLQQLPSEVLLIRVLSTQKLEIKLIVFGRPESCLQEFRPILASENSFLAIQQMVKKRVPPKSYLLVFFCDF